MSGWRYHWDVLKEALRADRERRKALVPTEEADFLPAALEVAERPVSPTARVTTWVALIGLVLAIVWTVFGRVDVVASAPGTGLRPVARKTCSGASAMPLRSWLTRRICA